MRKGSNVMLDKSGGRFVWQRACTVKSVVADAGQGFEQP